MGRQSKLKQQRAAERRLASRPSRRRLSRRAIGLLAGVTAFLLLGVGALVAVRMRPEVVPRFSTALPSGTSVEILRQPPSYRIVYRDEIRGVDRPIVSTLKVWVRRPFESREESFAGPPQRTGKRTSLTIGSFGRLSTASGDQKGSVLATPPAGPVPDYRSEWTLSDAVAQDLLQRREARVVGDRRCHVYRAGDSIGTGLKPPTEKRHSDVCIDEAGLVLEEIVTGDGAILRTRVATEVEENPKLDDALFKVGELSLSTKDGGGSVKKLTPDSQTPGDFWEAKFVPEGFKKRGRYTVVPPQAGFADPRQRSTIVASVSDVWERGPDYLIVDQGGTLQGAAPFSESPHGVDFELGALGKGQVILDLRASEARALLKGGRYVRVQGSLPMEQLVQIARSLEKVKGNGSLKYED